jgi:hypothetical protein
VHLSAVVMPGYYKVWGTKINSKALSYFAYPEEVIANAYSLLKTLQACAA